eukprot:CAMPEP_0198226646 /NCGR_PEP_ID=MMETSP1445-20131203/106049_1 /TAXON_ID=36898 /ORGANISM="Pyramimonas sp., Strain CCMP2087" /LENGTH=398 /DNA_ID=CAMNT_0043906497 /DNA_START=349 /DNA_END=1546 /DNA_ORIENTATION=-
MPTTLSSTPSRFTFKSDSYGGLVEEGARPCDSVTNVCSRLMISKRSAVASGLESISNSPSCSVQSDLPEHLPGSLKLSKCEISDGLSKLRVQRSEGGQPVSVPVPSCSTAAAGAIEDTSTARTVLMAGEEGVACFDIRFNERVPPSWQNQHLESVCAYREATQRHKENRESTASGRSEGRARGTSESVACEKHERTSSPDLRADWKVRSASTRRTICSDRARGEAPDKPRTPHTDRNKTGEKSSDMGSVPLDWRRQRTALQSMINADRKNATRKSRDTTFSSLAGKEVVLRAPLRSRVSNFPDGRTTRAAERRAARYVAAGKASLAGPPEYKPPTPMVIGLAFAPGARSAARLQADAQGDMHDAWRWQPGAGGSSLWCTPSPLLPHMSAAEMTRLLPR